MIGFLKKMFSFDTRSVVAAFLVGATFTAVLAWKSQQETKDRHYVNDRAAEELLLNLRAVLESYKTEYGKYPESLQLLVERGYLVRVPSHLGGRNYMYETDGAKFMLRLSSEAGGIDTGAE